MGDIGTSQDSARKSAALRKEGDEDVHFLVTGFDIWSEHEANPSWLIAHSLPQKLPPRPADPPGTPTIHLHTIPSPLRVSYETVAHELPPMIFSRPPAGDSGGNNDGSPAGRPNFDAVLLIGMAAGRNYYTMETVGMRDGYYFPDVDEARTGPEVSRRWAEEGLPELLTTGFNWNDVLRKWEFACFVSFLIFEVPALSCEELGSPLSVLCPLEKGLTFIPWSIVKSKADVRLSDDAGRFLCDFSYYTAMAEYRRHAAPDNRWGEDQSAPVVFLHVPGNAEEEDVERGRLVAEGLVRSIVFSEKERNKAGSEVAANVEPRTQTVDSSTASDL